MNIRLITDSAADLDADFIREHGITVLPMRTLFGEETFLDGVELSPDEFYEKLIESDELPKTSQLNPHDYEEAFARVKAAGDCAIVFCLSSGLSGSYANAVLAAEEYPGIIYPIDTRNVTIGEHILIELAIQLLKDNPLIKPEALVSKLDEMKEKICVVALLDTLEYLKKGGRIPAAAAVMGELLSIKPVIAIEEGKVAILGKARGSKKGNNMLVTEIEKHGGIDYALPICLGYSGLSDHLLEKYMEDSAVLWEGYRDELTVSRIGSTIGTHVGPGAIAVAFFHR